MKSDLMGCNGSVARGFLILANSDFCCEWLAEAAADDDSESEGLSNEYSQMLLAPQLKRLWTMVSCSGTQTAPDPDLAHLIWLT